MTSQSFSEDPGSPNKRKCVDPECDGVAVERDDRAYTFWECEQCGHPFDYTKD